jgi:quercetin dioxygenase-like cupin family protein
VKMHVLSLVLACAFSAFAQQPGAVDRKDVDSRTKLESVVNGYLTDLNGKYKLRVSELTFKPGGYVGEHHHLGPGMRVVTAGELTFVQGDKTTIYRPGDVFYEPGNVTHTAHNKSNAPVVVLSFEIVPMELQGSTQVLPRTK